MLTLTLCSCALVLPYVPEFPHALSSAKPTLSIHNQVHLYLFQKTFRDLSSLRYSFLSLIFSNILIFPQVPNCVGKTLLYFLSCICECFSFLLNYKLLAGKAHVSSFCCNLLNTKHSTRHVTWCMFVDSIANLFISMLSAPLF